MISAPRLRLTTIMLLAFLLVGSALAIGYSVFSARNFIRGMDSVMLRDMEQTLTAFMASPQSSSGSTEFRDFYFARHWDELPQNVREAFGELPPEQGVLTKEYLPHWGHAPAEIFFLLRYPVADGEWLVSRRLQRSPRNTLMESRMNDSRRDLYVMVAGSLLLLVGVGLLLFYWFSVPLSRLVGWTRNLQPAQLAQPTPDFGYPDLDQLAETIRSSLASVHDSLEREQAFLRHTSHELRTPISVVRSNVDLLNKLAGREGPAAEQLRSAALARLQRAGQTMTYLTETLLWLSRDELEELPAHELDLAMLVQQLVEDMRYLLANKQVQLTVNTTPCRLLISESAARIVLGNLIRNAFQHTWEGEVLIEQQGSTVRIFNRNQQQPGENSNADLGFGLGLQLTERLTRRLGWAYRNQGGADGHEASVNLG